VHAYHLQAQQQWEEERKQEREEHRRAEERARARREAPAPERYVPRGHSPHRYPSSSESEDLPLPPTQTGRRRLASQIASRPTEASVPAAALPSKRSRSLSPDPVRTAVNHAEPPRHTVAPSPPRRVPSQRSPSPAPKRQRREDSGTDHRRSNQPSRDDYSHRDDYRSRNGSRSVYQSSQHGADRDRGHESAAIYGDRQGRSGRDEDGRHADRDSRPAYGDRERTRDTGRGAYGDRDHRRTDRDEREERQSRHRGSAKRSMSPVVRYSQQKVTCVSIFKVMAAVKVFVYGAGTKSRQDGQYFLFCHKLINQTVLNCMQL